MSKLKAVLALLLFTLYLVGVWFGVQVFFPDQFALVFSVMTAFGLTVLLVYLMVSARSSRAPKPGPPPQWQAPEEPVGERPDSGGDELVALMATANRRLAESRAFSEGVSPQVTDLPLYLVVGEAGAGKTTAIVQSRLDHDLLAGDAYGPTRTCNYWFAKGTVFVDVSGKLFLEDQKEWSKLIQQFRPTGVKAFLRGLLRKRRHGGNLCGAVLVQDVGTFVRKADESPLDGLGRNIQARLRAAAEAYGGDIPVYVLLTNCEKVPYFEEYFGRLSGAEDAQIFGCTLADPGTVAGRSQQKDTITEQLSGAFNQLYVRLAERRVEHLSRERSAEKRGAVYEFPRELRRLRRTLLPFIAEICRPSPLHPGPYLRGFYFTGVRQGAARFLTLGPGVAAAGAEAADATILFRPGFDQTISGSASGETAFGRAASFSAWSFLGDLFGQLVDPKRMVAVIRRASRRAQIYRYLAAGGLSFLLAVLAFSFSLSWFENSELLSRVETAGKEGNRVWKSGQSTLAEQLEALESLRVPLAELNKYEFAGVPWKLSWWLYSGSAVLPPLRRLYFDQFNSLILEDSHRVVLSTLNEVPANPSATEDDQQKIYNHLKTHLTVSALGCEPETSFLVGQLAAAWAVEKRPRESELVLARRQLEFYADALSEGNPVRIEQKLDLVNRARTYLKSVERVQTMYASLLHEVNEEVRPPESLASLVPDYQRVLAVPPTVSPAFGLDGWAAVRKRIESGDFSAGEPCVVGTMEAVKGLTDTERNKREVESLYIKDYIGHWKKVLRGTRVLPYDGPQDAAKKLEILSDNRGPLLGLLFLTGKNTNFGNLQPLGTLRGIAQRVEGIAQSARNSLGLGSKDSEQQGVEELRPVDISAEFQPVRWVVDPSRQEKWSNEVNDEYLDQLLELRIAMASIARARADQAQHNRADQAANTAENVVKRMARQFDSRDQGIDEDVERLLLAPIEHARRYIITDPGKAARSKLNAALRRFCTRGQRSFDRIRSKFPFSRWASVEASPRELADVFAFEVGTFWRFYEEHLPDLVVNRSGEWIQNPDVPEPTLTREFLAFFNHMSNISFALFELDARIPNAEFAIRPRRNDLIDGISFKVHGAVRETSMSNPETVGLSWPGSSPGAELDIVAGAVQVPFGAYGGHWAWFRLIQDADHGPPGSGLLELSKVRQGNSLPRDVIVKGQPVTISLQVVSYPGNVREVFQEDFFTRVVCPRAVVK